MCNNTGMLQDGLFTLSEMECMGSCVNAPMIAVADYRSPDATSFTYQYYEDLTTEDTIRLLEDLKAGKTPEKVFNPSFASGMAVKGVLQNPRHRCIES